MFLIALILTTVLFVLRFMKKMHVDELSDGKEVTNGASWSLGHLWTSFIDQYGIPFGQFSISLIYSIYLRFTLFNVTIFLLKYVPTGIYTYKLLKNIYKSSRERIKRKQMEMEDIELQIQIVNTKLCVRDAEFTERAEQKRRYAERLLRVRARVHDIIAANEELRRALDSTVWDDGLDSYAHSTSEEDRECLVDLLKELKYDQLTMPDRMSEKMESGEHAHTEPSTPENSIYSSLSDVDIKQDYRVKIVKVTNVYKVAYLKHCIKQKRLRRASKQALLKKKIETIKKLLEDWQKSLSMVINSKLLTMDSQHLDVASQEAMGDYSKPNLRESSDSDSDLKNNCSDGYYDEYSLSWAQNPYRTYAYNYEDISEPASKEYDCQEYGDIKYGSHQCECNGPKGQNVLFILPEETNSQVAIEEVKDEEASDECNPQDLILL